MVLLRLALCQTGTWSPYFLWNSDSDSEVRKFRTLDSDFRLRSNKPELWLHAQNQTPTLTLAVCSMWCNISVLSRGFQLNLQQMTGHASGSSTGKNCTPAETASYYARCTIKDSDMPRVRDSLTETLGLRAKTRTSWDSNSTPLLSYRTICLPSSQ